MLFIYVIVVMVLINVVVAVVVVDVDVVVVATVVVVVVASPIVQLANVAPNSKAGSTCCPNMTIAQYANLPICPLPTSKSWPLQI